MIWNIQAFLPCGVLQLLVVHEFCHFQGLLWVVLFFEIQLHWVLSTCALVSGYVTCVHLPIAASGHFLRTMGRSHYGKLVFK